MDISLFKILLENTNSSIVDDLLHNNESDNWLTQPLRNHIHYKIDHFFWLETQKTQLRRDWFKNPSDELKKVEKEQEVIYSNLKQCKNLAKYYIKSCNKMKSIQDLSLLDKLDFNNIEEVEKRLNKWHEVESNRIMKMMKVYPMALSKKQNKNITKKAEQLWKYIKSHGVQPKRKHSSSTNLDNVY